MGFPDLLQETVFAPLRGPNASALLKGCGQAIASLYAKGQKMNQAMWAHMPTYAADPSCLPPIGNDRLIGQGFQEPNANYAIRLKKAFDSWQHAGSALSELQQILGYVFPSTPQLRLVHTSVGNNTSAWYNIPAGSPQGYVPDLTVVTPYNWNWDNNLAQWWRAWVIIYPGALWSSGGTWGDGGTWGSAGKAWGMTATPQQAQTLTALVRQWKSKHTWVPWIIMSFDSTLFDPTKPAGGAFNPDGNWASWAKIVNGQFVASRFTNARYIDGSPRADQVVI